MKNLILLVACLTVKSCQAQDFILSRPQVFNTYSGVKFDGGTPGLRTPSKYYEVPSQLTTPSTFYQVPSVVSVVTVVTEPSPPPPTVTTTPPATAQLTEDSVNTVLSKPVAITSAETDKFFISPAVSSALSVASAASSSTSSKLTTGVTLSAGTALLISFLLSLIPTLAVSIPFIAFRRRIVTRGKRSSDISPEDIITALGASH